MPVGVMQESDINHIYHQVLAGVRVDALEVDAVLCSHSAVAQAAVKGVRALAGVDPSGVCCLHIYAGCTYAHGDKPSPAQ